MDVLDQNNGSGNTVSTSSVAMKWALYGGIACILVKLIDYLVFPMDYSSMEAMTASSGGAKMILGFLTPIIFIATILLAIKSHSELEGRGFSFGRGLGTGVLTGLFMGVLIGIWTYIQFGMLDTGYQEFMNEMMSEAIEDSGEEGAEMAMGMMSSLTSPGMMAFYSVIMNTLGGLIIGLIGGGIFKKD